METGLNLEVSGSFMLYRAKQRQRNVQKKCAARAKLLFLLIRPTDFFWPFSLPSPSPVMLHGTICNNDF